MSDQQTANVERATTPASDVVAEVSWALGSRPPEVTLSFQGLNEPVALLDQLRSIGWDVPATPPRPANAIDWTPDPVAGTDYTVLPWTVNQFRLSHGDWRVASEEVGDRTLDALRHHLAEIVGTSQQIIDHEVRWSKGERGPLTQPDVADVATPVAAPSPVLAPGENATNPYRYLVLLGFSAEDDPLPGFGQWIGISGRQKTRVQWNETCIGADQPIPGLESMGTHVANGAGAWYADTSVSLPEHAPAGLRIIRLVLPDMTVNDAKVRRLNKVLGDSLETLQLQSLAMTNTSAVLAHATIGANSFEMLKSNLCLRMPTAIIRTLAQT